MNTTKMLGEAIGIQSQGTRDKTDEQIASSLVSAIIIGQFKRGRIDKPMVIHQGNIRGQLGYDPQNHFYNAVQDCLDTGMPSIQVLRVGAFNDDGNGSCEGATNEVIITGMSEWLHNEAGQSYYVTVSIDGVSELKNTDQSLIDFINEKFDSIVIASEHVETIDTIKIKSINDSTVHMSIVRDTTQVVTPQLFYLPWDINGLNTLLALQVGQSLSPSYDDLAVVDVDLLAGTVVGKDNRLTIKDSRYAGWNVTAAEFRAGHEILFIKLENVGSTRAALVAVTRSVFGGNYDTLMTIPFNEYNIETSDTADMSPDGKFITYAVRNPNDGNSWRLSCYMRTADTNNYASITGQSLVVSTSNVTNVRYDQDGNLLMWAIGGRIYSATVSSDGALLNGFNFAAKSTGVNTAVWTGGDVFNADQSLVKYCSRQADQIWMDGAIGWGDGFYFLVANNVGWIRFSVSPREEGFVSIGFARIVGHSITKTIDAVPLDVAWDYPVLYKIASKALNVNIMTGAIAEVDLTVLE